MPETPTPESKSPEGDDVNSRRTLQAPARAMLSEALDHHLRETAGLNSSIAALVEALPERMRHWAVGEAGTSHAIPIERWEGPWAAEYAWRDLFHRRKEIGSIPWETCGVFPNINRFRDPTAEGTASFAEAVSHYERARSIFQDPMPRFASKFFEPYLDAGAEIKTHRNLPTWMWVDSDSTVAFPDTWGEADPTSVTLFHSPVLASLAIELFEQLWATGHSLPSRIDQAEWTPLLSAMHDGATLEVASRRLRISPRTGKRRLDAAMAYYGTNSLFELGIAWGTDVAQLSKPSRFSSPGWQAEQ